jgi:hypothetical protein
MREREREKAHAHMCECVCVSVRVCESVCLREGGLCKRVRVSNKI